MKPGLSQYQNVVIINTSEIHDSEHQFWTPTTQKPPISNFFYVVTNNSVERQKPGTHQADVKELVAMKADCIVASCLGQKAALENTKWSTGDGQLACAFCACVQRK